jgi:hypothetical protein
MMGTSSGTSGMGGSSKTMSGHNSMGYNLFSGKAFGMGFKGTMIDVKARMKGSDTKMGVPSGITHHIMIMPDKPLKKGTRARVIVTYPSGIKKEVGLMAMGKHMGADLNLTEKGKYNFKCLVTSGGEEAAFKFSYEVE